ncbi:MULTISPECIES: hypothetical protein [Methanothrix]|jgi:hypothetical protein|uniref:hypothetical protein n=1 Tax=Methanothrix TaxID=2222 RepID=UPI0012FE8CC8|nr:MULTISPECIES: hypothetical protein [Methanothrix]
MKLDVPPQRLVLARSDEQLEYEISSHDWDHLKDLIDDICPLEQIHLTLATFFLGISITAFFGVHSFTDDIVILGYPGKLLSWAICAVFFLGFIPCSIYAYKQRNDITASKDSVIRYLNHLEKKFGIESDSENEPESDEI